MAENKKETFKNKDKWAVTNEGKGRFRVRHRQSGKYDKLAYSKAEARDHIRNTDRTLVYNADNMLIGDKKSIATAEKKVRTELRSTQTNITKLENKVKQKTITPQEQSQLTHDRNYLKELFYTSKIDTTGMSATFDRPIERKPSTFEKTISKLAPSDKVQWIRNRKNELMTEFGENAELLPKTWKSNPIKYAEKLATEEWLKKDDPLDLRK